MLCILDQLEVIDYKLNETITADRYRRQLIKLSQALKNQRPQYAERHDKVILQHDNASAHVANVEKNYLENFKWEVLPHLTYSPDITPSDYHLFRSMTHGLAEQRFSPYDDTKKWVED